MADRDDGQLAQCQWLMCTRADGYKHTNISDFRVAFANENFTIRKTKIHNKRKQIILQLHVDLTIREIAKFHAISYCMTGENNISDKYSLLNSDSIYRADTYQVTGYGYMILHSKTNKIRK